MDKVRATLTVLLSVSCTAFACEAKSQAAKEIVVETTIPRAGFSMAFDFDALWMMSDGHLVKGKRLADPLCGAA